MAKAKKRVATRKKASKRAKAMDLLDTPGARVVRVSRRLPHGSTSCDRAFQRSTGVHGLLQFLGPVFVLSRRNPPMVFGIWIAK